VADSQQELPHGDMTKHQQIMNFRGGTHPLSKARAHRSKHFYHLYCHTRTVRSRLQVG